MGELDAILDVLSWRDVHGDDGVLQTGYQQKQWTKQQIKDLYKEINRRVHDTHQNDGSCNAEESIEREIENL